MKAHQTTHWLPETLACDRKREREGEKKKKKNGTDRLGARNSFPFLPKTELIPVGYPCVGWLLHLRRRYAHRCLQIWLPPAASDWIQGWDSATPPPPPKHKMASRTSAILGLLKNTIRSTCQVSVLSMLAHEESAAPLWWTVSPTLSRPTQTTHGTTGTEREGDVSYKTAGKLTVSLFKFWSN